MRLDEVTQLAGGLCLRFTDGSVKHMDNEEAWDAADKLIGALSRRERAFGEVRESCEHKHWMIDGRGKSCCRDCGQPGASSSPPLRRVK